MIPIKTNVLVKPYPSDEFSEGGLYVPESARRISNKVLIVEVGNSVTKVKKGQTGFRVKQWGQEFLIDGGLHYMMDQSAIIALQ